MQHLTVQPLGRQLEFARGDNLLETLRKHEIPVSYSCIAGRCGTCRCTVLEGEVIQGSGENAPERVVPQGPVLACQTTLLGDCTVEVAEPDEVVVHPARVLKARVVGIEELNHDVLRLLLQPPKPFAFSSGQYARLQFAPDLVRPYSMAGLTSDELLEFHVRRVPHGRVTAYIASQLREGDAVRVTGPLGTAYLRHKHEGPMLCVAGGTGLAPILSIVRGALASGMQNPIHLYFGVRADRDLYGRHWLEALSRQHPKLSIHVVPGEVTARPGFRAAGLVTEAVAADWPDLSGWRAYLCGPPPMVDAATVLVTARGVAPLHVHADAFYANAS